MKKGRIIVLGGKGGVGKTAISAILVKLLLQRKEKLLLIDADPVVSVTFAVGGQPQRTIGEFRERMIEDGAVVREVRQRATKEVIRDLVIPTGNNFDILVMGRSEGKGCFCGINDLLQFGIESLCNEYDTILIDCEAGIEQVNRRAVHRIDQLILITDTSKRGMETVSQVRELACKYFAGHPFDVSLLVNRVRYEEDEINARALAEKFGFIVTDFIPEDPNILRNNAKGISLIDLPDDSPSVSVMSDILGKFGL